MIVYDKVGSLIAKDVGHVFLPAFVGHCLLLSFVISDPTLFKYLFALQLLSNKPMLLLQKDHVEDYS